MVFYVIGGVSLFGVVCVFECWLGEVYVFVILVVVVIYVVVGLVVVLLVLCVWFDGLGCV